MDSIPPDGNKNNFHIKNICSLWAVNHFYNKRQIKCINRIINEGVRLFQ